jgi:CheY-like chemotaxis protein
VRRARAVLHLRSPSEEVAMTSVPRVLIIDDDEDFRASLRSILEAEGYVVDAAASGHEGLDAAARNQPAVIILDVMMESSTEGYVVNQRLKFGAEPLADVPIIMMSSIQESPDELYPRAEEVGMIRPDFYLSKPVDIPRFLDVVARAAARRVRV